MIVAGNQLFYDPRSRQGWVKEGISQDEIPEGIDTPVVFTNISVIPMDTDTVLSEQTVLVKDGIIQTIGNSSEIDTPDYYFIVDGEGKFLMPGLSDMMTHTSGSENDLLLYLATGITTIRIMGNDPIDILEWRDQINAGTRVGPNMWVWWPQIQNNTVWPEDEMEEATRGGKTWVHTTEEAEQLVSEMLDNGVDGIKPHVVFSSEIYQALLNAAKENGLPFDGHAPDDLVQRWLTASSIETDMTDNWDAFRKLGVPALTHVEELIKMVDLVDKDERKASEASIYKIARDVADDGMWITTTIHPFGTWGELSDDYEGTMAKYPEIKYLHPEVFASWDWGGDQYIRLGSLPNHPYYVEAQEKMLLALHDSGVNLMSGTDAAVPMMVPGFSLHDELETMVSIGLSPYEVLKTSTYNPALYLGELSRFGTIQEGKRADMVLLRANPLGDIRNTRQIEGTMVKGTWYSGEDLQIMLEKIAQDYEGYDSGKTVFKVLFWIGVTLFAIVLVWFIVFQVKRLKRV
jgi:hypothetical protein